jgi:hypothetical protein
MRLAKDEVPPPVPAVSTRARVVREGYRLTVGSGSLRSSTNSLRIALDGARFVPTCLGIALEQDANDLADSLAFVRGSIRNPTMKRLWHTNVDSRGVFCRPFVGAK